MMIESSYNDPLDHIRPPSPLEAEDDHVYQSLDEIGSQGSISNILGRLGRPPPKAPTPVLKRRQPLAERSNLPPNQPPPPISSSKKIIGDENPGKKKGQARSRKDLFLFWKQKSKKSLETTFNLKSIDKE